MAAEPEKKIEELLQSYSRKRREDGGAPLEMHPATRRMLQGEVARQGRLGAPSPTVSRPWWKALLLFGPKYAGALGMFAILALGVWVITQQDRQSVRVRQEASERRAGAEADSARPLGELAQRENEKVNEVDDLARVPSPSKEAENKKAELSKARGDFLEQQKVQMRDSAGSPVATATPPAPPQAKLTEELLREKQVPLQNGPQVGQRIANVVAGGAGASADKNSAVLADKPGAPEEQFYKRIEAKADALGVPAQATQPITSRLDLAAAKPAPTNYFAYSVAAPVTNVALAAEAAAVYAGVEVVTTTSARAEKLLAFGDSVAPGATEWAAVPAEQPAKNEVERTRDLRVLSRVVQEAESREGVSPVLLRRFSVEQNNSTISIRDTEDGSVYVGEMLALSEPNVDGKAKAAKDEFRQNAGEVRSGGVTFRASGINQRSKQVVIINGELTEEQERLGDVAGKSIAGVSGATAPAAPAPVTPAPNSTSASPADALSLGRPDPAAAGARQAQIQTGTTFRSTPAPALSRSTSATAPSTSTVFRATTLRARVQIGPTNELNFRAIRTR
jgi:hypothetical protein